MMKKVIVSYTMSVICEQVVEVPDDFEFTTYDPDSKLEELQDEIGLFYPKDMDVIGDDVNGFDFDSVFYIDFLKDRR